jgi:hypothetical protein
MKPLVSRILMGAAIVAVAWGLLGGCSTVPIPPTYTQAELKAICERRGGWWHDDNLMGGLCEYQAASLMQAP